MKTLVEIKSDMTIQNLSNEEANLVKGGLISLGPFKSYRDFVNFINSNRNGKPKINFTRI